MKKQSLTFSIVSVLVLLVSNTLAYADWSPGDDYKMHSPQLPNPAGYDICLVHQPLADDFQCSESGFIRDIHFWVSWKGDVEDFRKVSWNVSIRADSSGNPGRVMWTLNQANASIKQRLYGTGTQGWRCPSTGQNISIDHTKYYQVNITGITDPMWQTSGQLYWLVIQAEMGSTTAEVGWKSSASSYFGQALYKSLTGGWIPIGTSARDLAFVITGGPNIEVDQIHISAEEIDLVTPIGKEKLTVSGPLTWHVFFEGPNEGDAYDDDADGRDEVRLQIVDLDWTDNSSVLGLVKVREHPSIPSEGLIDERANNTPGILDIPPFTPSGIAGFILVCYFEIEFDRQVLYTNQPSCLAAVFTHKPPIDPLNPFAFFAENQYLPLLNADGSISRSYFGLGDDWNRTFWEVDPFEFSMAQVEISKSGGPSELVDLTGFSSMYTKFDGPGPVEGRANDGDGDGLDEVSTELASLDLSGSGHTLGPIKMRLRPNIRSLGEIEENTNNTSTILDLPPFALTGTASSFFDIFFEVEIDRQVYHNVKPLRWSDFIDHKPPRDALYESSEVIPLVDASGNPSIYSLIRSRYKPGFCGDDAHPVPIGDFNKDCMVNFLDMAVFAQHWLECTRDVCP